MSQQLAINEIIESQKELGSKYKEASESVRGDIEKLLDVCIEPLHEGFYSRMAIFGTVVVMAVEDKKYFYGKSFSDNHIVFTRDEVDLPDGYEKASHQHWSLFEDHLDSFINNLRKKQQREIEAAQKLSEKVKGYIEG